MRTVGHEIKLMEFKTDRKLKHNTNLTWQEINECWSREEINIEIIPQPL